MIPLLVTVLLSDNGAVPSLVFGKRGFLGTTGLGAGATLPSPTEDFLGGSAAFLGGEGGS